MKNKQLESRRWWGMGGAQSPAFVRNGKACMVKGGAAGAVMDELVQRVQAVLAGGADPKDVLVLCADPTSAARIQAELGVVRAEGTVETLAERGAVRVEGADGQVAGAGEAGDALEVQVGPGTNRAAGAGEVRVLTCRELACAVLADPDSAAATGMTFSSGYARLLGAYETDFLMEDVKTLGARPKRLREMLKFFYRGWTELADEDPEWLFTVEEIDTFEFLTCELQYLGAMMEPQVSNLATKALRMEGQVRERFARRHVFVYGYQSLSRASQLLCQLVASEELVAGAGPDMGVDVFESYAYPAGVEDFARLNPAVEVVEVGVRGAGADKVRDAHSWKTPADEVEGTVDAIVAAVEAGADAEDIAVVTFHPWWTQQMARTLQARGLQANAWLGAPKLHGDIRELDRCLGLRAVTLLRLLADEHDGMAWRSWFGFGDYLARSNQFAEMRRRVCGMHIGEGCTVAVSKRAEVRAQEVASACDEGATCGDVRGACGAGTTCGDARGGATVERSAHGAGATCGDVRDARGKGAAKLSAHGDVHGDLAAYGIDLDSDLKPLFAEVRDLRGPRLLAYLVETLAGPDVPLPASVRPLLALGPDADAAQMVAELDRLQFFSGVPARAGVTVASFAALADIDFDQVFVVGFANGLFPRADYFDLTKVTVDKQAKMGERDTRAARAMAGLGTRGLHVGSFERCERMLADRMGVKQVRIYAADDFGREMVEAAPSIYTDVLLGGA